MANNTYSTENQILVAIDIAKSQHEVLICWPNGKTKQLKVKSNLFEYNQFANYLESLDGCLIGFEPTGNYHRTLAYLLSSKGMNLVMVSSLSGARLREAMFNSWDKNDPKDCKVIIELMKSGLTQHYYDPLLNNFHDLQEISRTYHQIVLARTKVLHSLQTHYLPLYFPEIEKYLLGSRTQWFSKTFIRFPTPSSICKLSFDEFKKEASPLVGRKVHKDIWLYDLYQTAQSSIALPLSEFSVGVETFKIVLSEFQRLTDLRGDLEDIADKKLSDDSHYQILRSIPGIGPVVALIILAEAGNLKRFNHHRQFLKFCGFDLAKYQSGNSKGLPKLSKRGSSRLRYAFWLAATNAIRARENTFRKKYERYINKDPKNADLKRKAYTAVAVKMARVAYALIKQDSLYRCYHEDNSIPQ